MIVESALDFELVAVWLGAIFLFAFLGRLTGPGVIARTETGREITLSGSAVPLIRNLTFFALHYAVAVALALIPDRAQMLTILVHVISGGSIGYFAGWMFTLYRRLDDIPLARRRV